MPVHPLERDEIDHASLLTFEAASAVSAGDKDLLRQIARLGDLYRKSQSSIQRLMRSVPAGMTQAVRDYSAIFLY